MKFKILFIFALVVSTASAQGLFGNLIRGIVDLFNGDDDQPDEAPAVIQPPPLPDTEPELQIPESIREDAKVLKPVQKPEEKPDQKPIGKPDKKPIEKPDQKPAEKPDQKPNQKPGKPTEKPDQKPTGKPGKPTEKPDQKPTEKPGKPSEKPGQKPTEKPGKPTEKPGKPTEKPDKPTEKPDKPTEKPGKPTGKPDKPTEKPDKPTEKPDKPIEKPDKKPIVKPDKKPVEKPDKKPAQKSARVVCHEEKEFTFKQSPCEWSVRPLVKIPRHFYKVTAHTSSQFHVNKFSTKHSCTKSDEEKPEPVVTVDPPMVKEPVVTIDPPMVKEPVVAIEKPVVDDEPVEKPALLIAPNPAVVEPEPEDVLDAIPAEPDQDEKPMKLEDIREKMMKKFSETPCEWSIRPLVKIPSHFYKVTAHASSQFHVNKFSTKHTCTKSDEEKPEPVVAVDPPMVKEPVVAIDPPMVKEPVVAIEKPTVEKPVVTVDPLMIEKPVVAMDEPMVDDEPVEKPTLLIAPAPAVV